MAFFRNTRRLIILLVSLVLLYTLVGFVVIPWVVKTQLPPMLSEQLGRTVLVKDIAFNPFVLSLSVHDFEVQEQDQSPLFGFHELFVNFQLSSIFRQAYTFEQIKLVFPYGLVKIRPDGILNVAELGPTDSSEAVPEETEEVSQDSGEEAGLPAIEISHLAIEQGMVEFHDESRPTPFSADIVPIEISLNNFTTRPDSENPYAITAEFNEGEVLQWEGTLVLEPFSSSGKISLSGLRLHTPWQYLQDQLRFEIHDGLLNVSTEYQLTTGGETVKTTLTDGKVHVSELNMAAKGNTDTVLSIPSFDVEGVTVDIPQQQVTIPLVRSKNAKFSTWLNDKGQVNYQELFAPVDATEQSEASDGPPGNADEVSGDSQENERPWIVEIQDFAVQNYHVDFEDQTLETPAQLHLAGIDLQIKGLKTTFEEPFDLAMTFTLNETGNVETQGTIGVDPVVADLDLKLSELALAPFYPYVSPHVQFELADGAVDLEGKMQYQGGPNATPLVQYAGRIALNRLVANDPELTEKFLKVQSLEVNELELDVEPTTISIGEIKLTKPFVRATISENGTMNVSRVFSPPGSDADLEEPTEETPQPESSEPAKDPLPIKIGRVRLVNAVAQFADLSLEPNVRTGIQELTGTIAGLSSEQVAKADVDLKGKVDKYAPFEVKGKINPLSKDAYTDLSLLFENVDLTAVSPYSGKYAGHPITKGKLSLDLKYKIAKHILEGENKVLVDQLTMGKKTGSPDATSLPVPLALALLKDRHGKIDIDLPVSGNLSDPDFSYGGIVLQALLNLLTKAVTSPFNLIGGLMGSGGDDLQFIEFKLGSQDLDGKEQEKLNSLAKALEERPALRLEVTGTADPARDREALVEAKLAEQVHALHERNASASGGPASEIDGATISSDDERRLIRVLFVQKFGEAAAEKLETPPENPQQAESKNVDHEAQAKSESVQGDSREQMKNQLLDSINVSESEVRLLAQHRAQAIRDHLIQQGKIPEERVFLIEVQLNADADQDRVRSPLSLAAG